MGSASETEYHLLLAKDLGYITEEQFQSTTSAVQEVKRMLAALLKSLREQIDG
jgi:four helix bundle protein